jgi:hypothetical protein
VAERFVKMSTGDVSLGWDESRILLEAGGALAAARKIMGEFPRQWKETLLMLGRTWVPADSAELIRAVRMASVAGDDSKVILEFGKELRVLSSGQKGACEEVLDVPYDGPLTRIALSAEMLATGLAGCGDTAEISFTDSRAPVVLRGANLTWVIAPRRES